MLIIYLELLGSTPLCGNHSFVGLNIVTQEDADALIPCSVYNGSISVLPPIGSSTSITLHMTTIEIDLMIKSDNLVSFSAPNLTTVMGNLEIESTSLASFSAPNLATVAGNLEITNSALLASAEIPQLSFASIVTLSDLPSLQEISFSLSGNGSNLVTKDGPPTLVDPDLAIHGTSITTINIAAPGTMGSIAILDNPNLTSVNISGVATLNEFLNFANNNPNVHLSLPDLTYIWDSFTINHAASIDFPNLQNSSEILFASNTGPALNLPSLKYAQILNISNNANLTDVNMRNVSSIGALAIIDNPVLNSVQLDKLTILGREGWYIATDCWEVQNNPQLTNIEWDSLESLTGNTLLTGNFAK